MELAPEHLPDDVNALKALVLKLKRQHHREITRHLEENARLRERLNLLLAKRFGTSSEKIPEAQLRLFNEAEAAAEQINEPEERTVPIAAHTRLKGGRRPLPETLPRIEVVHDLADTDKRCPHDGTPLSVIGRETTEQLDVIPAKIQVIRHVRLKYACPCCEHHIKTAPLPPQPIPKSLASPGLLAHVAVSKYQDALPLYRQETLWQRSGADIPRATLAHWMVKAGALVQPVINLLRDELLAQAVIHCDETPVQVLKEPGKAAQSKSYMWVQAGADTERPVILFDYDPSRGGAIPKPLLGDFSGYLQTDGYEGYQAVCRENGITQVGCWAHARRRFDEALKAAGINPRKPAPEGQPPPKARRAMKALTFIRHLYAIEHRIRDKPPDARFSVRQAESLPVLGELRTWVDDVLPGVPPQSALGNALRYLHSQWEKLIRYCENGRLAIDNNRAENAIRPFVLGRKNWLFSDTVAGAKASANLYSVIESAKAARLEPYAYLRYLFTELPKANRVEDIEALLPYNCDASELIIDDRLINPAVV